MMDPNMKLDYTGEDATVGFISRWEGNKDYQGIQENVKYPSLDQYKKDWDLITPLFREAIVKLSDNKLDETFDMEGQQMSNYDLVTFFMPPRGLFYRADWIVATSSWIQSNEILTVC